MAPLWKFLTFTYNIAPDIYKEKTFDHSWSLCIEEQFYILLPAILGTLIYFKAIRKSWLVLIAFFLAGFVIRFYSYQNMVEPFTGMAQKLAWWKWIFFPTYCRLDGLLTGVSIAALFEFKPLLKERICKYGNLFLVAGIVLLMAIFLISRPGLETFGFTIFGFPLISIGYGAIVIGAVSPVSFRYKNNSKITATVAQLSYAAYLVHKIMIHITQDLLSKAGVSKTSILMFAACAIAVLTGAFVINRLVEKPFLRLREKVLKKREL